MAAPTIIASQTGVSSTSNSTTFNVTLGTIAASALAGDVVACFVSADGNPTLLENNAGGEVWDGVSVTATAANGTIVSGHLFITTVQTDGVVENLAISSSASEQYSHVSHLIRSSTGALALLGTGSSNGSSTNSDPAAITNSTGASRDTLVICSRHGDSTVTASAAPTNYGNLQTRAGGGTAGASTNTANRAVTIANSASEDPGTFTSASEQWGCITAGWYELSFSASLDQYRFYADGTESGSTALASQNTAISLEVGDTTIFHLRVLMQSLNAVSGGASDFYEIVRRHNGGAWANIDTTSSLIQNADTTQFADGAATTSRLTGGTGTFQTGEAIENTGISIDNFQLVGSRHTEFLIALKLSGSGLTASDTLQFGIFRNGLIIPQSVTPTINIVAAAPDYTLTADGGSYALTGTAAGTLFNRKIAANTTSFALTGTAANTLFNRRIAADGGSFTLTGANANLALGRRLVADAGMLSLTGTDATLTYTPNAIAYTLTAEAGSFAVSGTAAGLERGWTLAADAGSFVLSGMDASPERGWSIGAAVGSFALGGTDAALRFNRRVAADPGSFSFTGTAAALALGRRLVADAALFSQTGTAATLAYGRRMAADGGAFALSGAAANVLFGRRVEADAGSYVLSGTAALFPYGRVMVASGGTFAFTGSDAGLAYEPVGSYTLAATAASFAVSGSDAALKYARIMSAATGSFALTGTAANLRSGRRLAADPTTFTLTGTAAGALYGRRMTASGGSYALVGTAATTSRQARLAAVAAAFDIIGSDANIFYTGLTHYVLTADAGEFDVIGSPALLGHTIPGGAVWASGQRRRMAAAAVALGWETFLPEEPKEEKVTPSVDWNALRGL